MSAPMSFLRPQRPSTKASSSSTPTSRSLTRKASILSFNSDKDTPYTVEDDYSLFTAPYPTSPIRLSNNTDARRAFKSNGRIDEPRRTRRHQTRSSLKSITSLKGDTRPKERKGKEKEVKLPDGAYHFPELQRDTSLYDNGETTPKSRTRLRSSTNPSQYNWGDHSHMPSFRDSGSSSLTHFETPPHTPVDELLSLRGSLERISVVAPVSGVEVMDAMVDGMNGFGTDDRLFGRTSMSSRSSKAERAGFHPLYHPPLPTPPPGVTLGGGIARKSIEPSMKDSDEDDEESKPQPFPRSHERRSGRRPPSSSRSTSTNTVTRASQQPNADIQFPTVNPSIDEIVQKHTPKSKSKQRIPSISEIIRSHGPKQTSQTSKSSRPASLDDGDDPVMVPLTPEEEAELLSRSSVDSVAEEVLNTINSHSRSSPAQTLPRARSFAHRQSVYSESVADISIRSPRSDGASMYSFSATSSEPTQPPPFDHINAANFRPSTASQAIAQYLRSARLTTLLKLTCAPHASRDHPLTVSLSDLGSPAGFPLVVFLGLGCVRHVMGLYDEMAECLGLRLITIDRWGLGRTQTPQSKLARGIPEWSSVVAEVLDCLGINKCSIMAHSAGAPYALAFANQYPDRICGDICLLAPWIGEGAGYKWLKYVPNGVLKTAQAADWKIQAWMLGKPPTISYQGIGYDMRAPLSSSTIGHGPHPPHTSSRPSSTRGNQDENMPRPSIDSSVSSDYDDLRDFDGRFESRSTVGKSTEGLRPRFLSENKNSIHWSGGKKSSKGLLGKLRGGSNSQPPSPAPDKPSPSGSGRRLKALRSMGSLKSKASSPPGTISRTPSSALPKLPQPLDVEIGLGLDEIKWGDSRTPSPVRKPQTTDNSPDPPPSSFSRSDGNRSMSSGAYKSPPLSITPSPLSNSVPNSVPPSPVDVTGGSYQAMLGNALIAASHSESAKGTHGDLVQILNHDRVPWGFSYSDYPHSVRVWYGDRDERIAESAVRWLERTMGQSRCHVSVVKGADHGLMYKSAVVIDVFEQVHDYVRDD